MFEFHLVLRHLTQNQLLNPKRRNDNRGDRIQIGHDRTDSGATPGPGARSDMRPAPSTGDLVLLWMVSNLTNKPGM
jgi:hypothetical protein